MHGPQSIRRLALLAAAFALAAAGVARGQGPTLPGEPGGKPGSMRSALGPIPGAGANAFNATPGTDAEFLGGRPGPSFPRVPSSITTPGGNAILSPPPLAAPPRLKITDVPLYGPLEIPTGPEDEGPADGLTLDAALERLVRDNLALITLSYQIPNARADLLSAGLRANPLIYVDTQLVPYRPYDSERSGGPTQYNVNINHPIDYSFKRQARMLVASRVVSVTEAEYQNAVRIQIDNLYTVYVDLLAARETLRFAKASQVGLGRLLKINETLYEKENNTRADVGRARALMQAADLGVMDAEATLRKTRRSLALLLNLTPAQAEGLEVRGSVAQQGPPLPPLEELVRTAMESRPDLAAMRLGVGRSEAGVRLAQANRFGDAYLLYQPYTFQDNASVHAKSATSWALGITAPIPLWNRNQGGVARAKINTHQTRNDLAALERRIAAEVRDAEREYAVATRALELMERDLIPAARRQKDDTLQLFVKGELNAVDANNAQKSYNEVVRRYRDMLIRRRRSMLALNTAVGARVMP